MEWYNGTIMTYGETGEGKTYPMSGVTENYGLRGIIPRAISQYVSACLKKEGVGEMWEGI